MSTRSPASDLRPIRFGAPASTLVIMDNLTGVPLPLALAFLALLDGLSIGTLLIPVFLLLSPSRLRAGRILLYLATIAVFYLVVGMLFLWGLVNVVDVAGDALASPAGRIVRLVVGIGLLITSFLIPTSSKSRASVDAVAGEHGTATFGTATREHGTPASAAAGETDAASPRPGRLTRWRDRLLDPQTSRLTVMAVAIAAGLVEVATMLPYIVGMTMIADSPLDLPLRGVALAGYCLVMIAPALVLLVLRILAAPLMMPALRRLGAWLERTGAENTAWIIGIIGFLIARSAATELGLLG